ncbi:iron-sulfur cluster repair di-iron protein [Mesonia sp. MT50]|uniref:Iron-sulfur cluster repair di-iron protein n=1 Tax=Mesonia profundi TaxID=3070998 RepID=A0ABU1A0B1_9FLAO|nr:iron-sulfur cluster repair di-iron protein [Mesonia profundi]MDQ7916701.1 iron-sulfur cluster repair di-iron protein [Mesonia profundi]
MTISKDQHVGELVAQDYRMAQIFKDHKIDFCCNGDRSLTAVCEKKNISVDQLVEKLENVSSQKDAENINFDVWPLDLLADYIQKTHHRYVEKQSIVLKAYLDKLCKVHGNQHPELHEIKSLFSDSVGELAAHMKKEELILFPFIKKMNTAKDTQQAMPQASFQTVENPIEMMMHDHDAEGERFRKIAELSDDYTPPADACQTYRVTFSLLEEFENDLHKHIHLENNMLFPKAIALEKESLTAV